MFNSVHGTLLDMMTLHMVSWLCSLFSEMSWGRGVEDSTSCINVGPAIAGAQLHILLCEVSILIASVLPSERLRSSLGSK